MLLWQLRILIEDDEGDLDDDDNDDDDEDDEHEDFGFLNCC